MTEHELFLLAAGVSIGAHLTLLGWMVCGYVSGRRADRRRKARRARDDEKGYTLTGTPGGDQQVRQAGEPHPAELLEASVRGFELNLLDCLDRVDNALRRDGQL